MPARGTRCRLGGSCRLVNVGFGSRFRREQALALLGRLAEEGFELVGVGFGPRARELFGPEEASGRGISKAASRRQQAQVPMFIAANAQVVVSAVYLRRTQTTPFSTCLSMIASAHEIPPPLMNVLVSAMKRNHRADEASHDILYDEVSKEKMRSRACFQVLLFCLVAPSLGSFHHLGGRIAGTARGPCTQRPYGSGHTSSSLA